MKKKLMALVALMMALVMPASAIVVVWYDDQCPMHAYCKQMHGVADPSSPTKNSDWAHYKDYVTGKEEHKNKMAYMEEWAVPHATNLPWARVVDGKFLQRPKWLYHDYDANENKFYNVYEFKFKRVAVFCHVDLVWEKNRPSAGTTWSGVDDIKGYLDNGSSISSTNTQSDAPLEATYYIKLYTYSRDAYRIHCMLNPIDEFWKKPHDVPTTEEKGWDWDCRDWPETPEKPLEGWPPDTKEEE